MTTFAHNANDKSLAAGLYSGAMMMSPPYRPAAAPTIGFGAEIFFYMEIYPSRRAKTSKWGVLVGFCRISRRSLLHAYSRRTASDSPLSFQAATPFPKGPVQELAAEQYPDKSPIPS